MYYGKVRGQQRKLKRLLKYIEEIEPYKFINNSERFEHYHVPGDVWIEMPKTSSKVKTKFCKAWIKKTEEILDAKPEGLEFCKVVCDICIPDLWNSQIIIFYDREYYDSFWNRHGEYQDWTRIDDGLSFAKERNIITKLKEIGFKEIIHDEDKTYITHIWFYGEVDENA